VSDDLRMMHGGEHCAENNDPGDGSQHPRLKKWRD
jgi:hypothetical protein